ncbi:DUF3604 domain-containing protein [Parahaliea mediterranea]|uniref:DUF3604 domain-containing protein n=1 Tax=Parahaliea mediterranea TaxID=651086 RepID=UPI000E2F7EE6|nr:DUF3604 domain-containing protein [Parahaliea mediterranea]
MLHHIKNITLACAASLLPLLGVAQDVPPPTDKQVTYSPYPGQDFPNQVFFGDTHLHTAFSADAGLAMCILTPDDAYRFAKGEVVTSSQGIPARLQRPLDFLVVADHAENLGIAVALEENNPLLLGNEWGKTLAEIYAPRTIDARSESYLQWFGAVNTPGGSDPMKGSGLNETMWERVTEAAERHNDPGSFTAFIGYEWTSGPEGANLHRNIIFRDGKQRADQVIPFSAYDSEDPEKLWDWMDEYEKKTGGQVLAIPHNGNLSNGRMFDDVTLSGEALTAAYAERRQRWEPLYEVTQIKGDAEAHPLLSPNDEFADYYTWDKGSYGPEPKTPDMLPREYARPVLKRGIQYESRLGSNPFKFGMVGSSDAHTGLSTTQEDNFFGKVTLVEPTGDPARYEEKITGRFTPDDSSDDQIAGVSTASGLAAVWSRENTREALWDAMKRRETFATTGTRLRVRVFAGWNFQESDLVRSDFAAHGYNNGVPMGGDLVNAPPGAAPTFLVRAVRDPDGANLDRVQVIKGWTTISGEAQEKIYDVVWAGDRQLTAQGLLPAVGNTVDTKAATYTNSIGSPYLQAFWKDPDFDAGQQAFYYIRVLEIPTPSWVAYDRKHYNSQVLERAVQSQQERAYTSPIWYTP